MLKKSLFLAYGLACWIMFLGVYAYTCGFLSGFLVPKAIDGTPTDPLWLALAVNAGLIVLFGVQHSVMARPGFKRWWTRIVPEPIERSTYVLISNLLMILLFWQWRPMGGTIWDVQDPAGRAVLYGLFAAGGLLVPVASFMTGHFDLFGVRQVWSHFRGETCPPAPFRVRGLYRWVRHPLYVGWMLLFWATPTMTAAHLVFAALTTAYVLAAVRLEERDLVALHGEAYSVYARRVSRFLPLRHARPVRAEAPAAAPESA